MYLYQSLPHSKLLHVHDHTLPFYSLAYYVINDYFTMTFLYITACHAITLPSLPYAITISFTTHTDKFLIPEGRTKPRILGLCRPEPSGIRTQQTCHV